MITEFAGNLSHHLEFGHCLVIVAKTIDAAGRFTLSLCSEKTSINKITDIALQFKVNFRQSSYMRNSRINGRWGAGETLENLSPHSCVLYPIKPGQFFMIYILACEEKFHIAIDNRAYCTYTYRLPLSTIRTVELKDHIQAIKQIDHRTVFPNPWPPIHFSDYLKEFSNDVPTLFTPGHVIVITALCFGKRGHFIIKFTNSDTKREELHFAVRFDERIVVRNAHNRLYDFMDEERHGGFPFEMDQQFKLAIAFTNDSWVFAVNGCNFCSFMYKSVKTLENLVGFKITCTMGLQMQVSGVDHLHMGDPHCSGFRKYSYSGYVCV